VTEQYNTKSSDKPIQELLYNYMYVGLKKNRVRRWLDSSDSR